MLLQWEALLFVGSVIASTRFRQGRVLAISLCQYLKDHEQRVTTATSQKENKVVEGPKPRRTKLSSLPQL